MPPFLEHQFKREEHVYANEAFSELLKDAVRFFHGTPVLPLPLQTSFTGAGVYAIYCIAKTGIYKSFGKQINRLGYDVPIYVGKAVPKGWRQNRPTAETVGTPLYSRLHQHAESIQAGRGVNLRDFACRFAILENETSHMIAALEAAVIAEHTPLWNSVIDGFGNHDPGARRVTGKRPQWDCLHPGRAWAARMEGDEFPVAELKRRVNDYFVGVRCRH